jgi:hypothetical protein
LRKLIICLAFLIPLLFGCGQKPLTCEQATHFLGERVTVCGTVLNAKYAALVKNQPTYLHLDTSHPNHLFSVKIMGVNRFKFKPSPEVLFDKKTICVTGMIVRGKKNLAEIIVTDPDQIKVK